MWRHIGDNPRFIVLDEKKSVGAGENSHHRDDFSGSNCNAKTQGASMRSSRASSSSLGGGLNGLNGGGGAGDIRQPLDWSSSSFGLFTGLLSLVALIINLIVYFALVNQVCTSLLHILTYNTWVIWYLLLILASPSK